MKKYFYFPEQPNGDNCLEVVTHYQKPQINWFNSKQEAGGFYLCFHRGKSQKNDKYASFSCMLFDGFKIKVLDATRDNKKKHLMMIEKMTEELAELAFYNKKAELYEKVNNLFAQ